MVTRDDARLIAERALDAAPKTRALQLVSEPIDRSEHWVFLYNTPEYLESGNEEFAVIGSGPIAVAKNDGTVTWLNSRLPLEKQV